MHIERVLVIVATLLMVSTVMSPVMAEMKAINPQPINQQQGLQQIESKAMMVGQETVSAAVNSAAPTPQNQ